MRAALLVLILMSAPLAGSMGAGAEFKCFQTPGEGIRCACIGASDCGEMKNSGNCKSEAVCDKGELRAIICAVRRRTLQKWVVDPPRDFIKLLCRCPLNGSRSRDLLVTLLNLQSQTDSRGS